MKKLLTIVTLFSVASSGICQSGDSATLSTPLDSLSYIIGRDVGVQLNDMETQLNMSAFSAGVNQAMNGLPSQIDSMAADSIRRQFANQVQEQMEEDQAEQAKEYKELSEAFLAQNKEREGVETTKSGLQYEIITQGDGPSAESSDSVRVSYTGMLVDSTVFDSTAEPVVLELARTIPGLAEGIKLMSQGGEYMFYVPSELAYGEQGIPPIIPPNAALIFRVKLDDAMAQEKKTGYKK